MGTARLTRFCIDYPHRATAQQLGRQISARTHVNTDTIRKLYRVFNAKLFISFLLFLEND